MRNLLAYWALCRYKLPNASLRGDQFNYVYDPVLLAYCKYVRWTFELDWYWMPAVWSPLVEPVVERYVLLKYAPTVLARLREICEPAC